MSLMKKRHNQKKGMHWNKNSWKEVQQCLIKNLKECHKPVPKERFEFSVRNVNLLPLNFWFNGQPTDLWGPCWLIRAYSNFISQLHSYHRDWSVMSKVPCTETKKKEDYNDLWYEFLSLVLNKKKSVVCSREHNTVVLEKPMRQAQSNDKKLTI